MGKIEHTVPLYPQALLDDQDWLTRQVLEQSNVKALNEWVEHHGRKGREVVEHHMPEGRVRMRPLRPEDV